MPMIACNSCDALNKQGATECAECGATLDAPAWPAPEEAARAARPTSADERREKSRARQEFARLKKTVLTVRSTYWAGVGLAVVQVLLAYTVYADVLPKADGDVLLVLQLFTWGQLALMVAGALLVLRSPFIWSVGK